MKKTVWGWIVAGVAAAGAAVAVAYEELKKPASGGGGGGGGGGGSTNTLQPNAAYTLTLSCPTPIIPVPAAPMLESWAGATLLAGIPISVNSVSTSGGSIGPNGGTVSQLVVSFKYTGSRPVALPNVAPGNGTACSVTLALDIASVPPVHHGGGGGVNFHVSQSVSLQNGQVAKANFLPGGAIVVTAPGTITGVNGTPVKSWSPGASTNIAIVTMSTWAGSIAVTWNNGQPQGGSIQVS